LHAFHLEQEIKMTFEEKYEPQTVAELIFGDKIAQATCLRYATGQPYKPLMLWGPPGTAKTTTARVIVRERYRAAGYDGSIEEFNAADLTREDYPMLANAAAFLRVNGCDPLILINEFDEIERDDQAKFRSWMDAHKWINLIVTTNEQPGVKGTKQKLIPALCSRFDRVELAPPSLADCVPRAQAILQQEGHVVSQSIVRGLLGTFVGDIRDLMPILEQASEQLQRGSHPPTPRPKLQMVVSPTQK